MGNLTMEKDDNTVRATVTLKDIAEKTGFTINTVSRALKDKPDISEKTIKLIKDTAKDMGYIGNTIAGALRSGLTKTIAVILGDISNPHFSILVKGIERAARAQKYTTFIINTDEDDTLEREAINSALSQKVDGIIICPAQKNKSNIEFLKSTNIPFVLIGRYFRDIDTDYVVCDDVNGGSIATGHLISKGHRDILFLNGPKYISSAVERLEGYVKAYEQAGIKYNPALVREISIKSGSVKKAITKVIKDGIRFTAVFAFSDMIAWETMYVLSELGNEISGQIDIVGFDNIQSKLMFPSALTTVKTSKTTMAKRAVAILLRKISKSAPGYIQEVIKTDLEIRL
jgi:LacI family transcriptional regulator